MIIYHKQRERRIIKKFFWFPTKLWIKDNPSLEMIQQTIEVMKNAEN